MMIRHPLTIALMGPPGCGKGTQARGLAERLNLAHISSDDIIRENIRQGTKIGKAFEEAAARGELGPTELVTVMIRDRISALSADGSGLVLDGFPRTLPQAEMLTDLGMPDSVVSLSVKSHEIIRRISRRLSCRCGAVYHRADAPPKRPRTCDRCGEILFTRPDDGKPKVRLRMEEYTRETLPLLDYYRDVKKLHQIDGTGGPDQVTKRIMRALGL